ncbi:MAG: AraC family transcriptional regulator [Siphonobacter aquaeclarae]|nr:AraC family transcriptional regulator [Siphonobacter aquaeclarae]
MNYQLYPVSPELRPWIRYFWSYDGFGDGRLHIRSFADPYPRLIFQDTREYAPVVDQARGIMPAAYLSGMDTRPTSAYWNRQFSHFGVSFYPHALPVFFGISATELVNEMPALSDVDRRGMTSRLADARNHRERVILLNRYFLERIQTPDAVIQEVFDRNTLALEGLKGIAATHRLSLRQVQRRFKDQVGVSVRTYLKLQRFEQVLQQLSGARFGDLTRIAFEAGYADQPHFNREFAAFSGLTPYQFLREQTMGSESASFIYAGDDVVSIQV